MVYIHHQYSKTVLGNPIAKKLGDGELVASPEQRCGQELLSHEAASFDRLKQVIGRNYAIFEHTASEIVLHAWMGCNFRQCDEQCKEVEGDELNMSPVLLTGARCVMISSIF